MELTAAMEALKALKFSCSVDLYTDSRYLQNAFTEGWLEKWQRNGWKTADKKPVANAELWVKLLALSGKHEVRWRWVRGHGDDEGNNRADELAVNARRRIADS
jgi:ribonuclease HI